MKKVTLITTVAHNVGDDFVRDGIAYLLERVLGPFEARLVHKHFPVTARRGCDRLHLHPVVRALRRLPGLRGDRLSRWLDARPLDAHGDAILECDLLVQCGAPVFWLNARQASQDNEWYGPLIRRRWLARHPRPLFLNLGAGACQPFASTGAEFAEAAATHAYIRELFDRCTLTTVRDRLAEKIVGLAGRTAPLLPCPSLFARHAHGIPSAAGEFVALNFMPLGGHYQFEPPPDAERWHRVFAAFLQRLGPEERCVMVCHDRAEEAYARRHFPAVPRFFSTDHRAYLSTYARAKYGLVNRVHAAFALASFGRPSIVIGNDSRAHMAELIDLPVFDVRAVDSALLTTAWEQMKRRTGDYAAGSADRLATLERDYLALVRTALERHGLD
jgi:hypothetical protein